MALDALMSIIPPPKNPFEAGSGRNWVDVEKSLGTGLPTDYKKYINLYGTGELAGFIWVYNPFSDKRHGQNLLLRVSEVLSMYREIRAEFGEKECPYPLYPEPDGLFPWGHVNTGAELFWRTSGNPEQWTVVVNEARGPQFQQFQQSMTEFLTSLVIGRLKCDILPKPSKRNRATFIPLRE